MDSDAGGKLDGPVTRGGKKDAQAHGEARMVEEVAVNLKLRRLRLSDSAFCRELASDPAVREGSMDRRPPTFFGHLRWMWRWTQDGKAHAFVILREGFVRATGPVPLTTTRIGIVRCQEIPTGSEVGIALCPGGRGRGIARDILRSFNWNVAQFVGHPVYARIRHDNTASLQAFRSAGYEMASNEEREAIVNEPGVLLMRWNGGTL